MRRGKCRVTVYTLAPLPPFTHVDFDEVDPVECDLRGQAEVVG